MTDQQNPQPMPAFLRDREVCKIVGISTATLWRWVKSNNFPKPVKLGPKRTAWHAETINAWIAEKVADAI